MVGIGRGGVGLAGDWRECLAEAHASEAVAGEGDDTSGTSHASLAESQRNIATARAVGGQRTSMQGMACVDRNDSKFDGNRLECLVMLW